MFLRITWTLLQAPSVMLCALLCMETTVGCNAPPGMRAPHSKTLTAKPVLDHEKVIPVPKHVTVTAVATAGHGSFVVVGASGSAWARTFSKDGQTLWEFFRGDVDYSTSDSYLDAALMPDGSTFLCGRWIHPPGSFEPSALLTHVDAKGKRLGETVVLPSVQPGSSPRFAYFQSCIRDGSHVLLHGYLSRKADWTVPGMGTELHWFAAVDGNGKVLWQREVPEIGFQSHSHYSEGDVLLAKGNEFFVSKTDNRQTEVLRLGPSGDLLGRLVLTGPFHLVRPLQDDSQVELWGLMAGKGQFIRLTHDLREEKRTPLSFEDPLSTTEAIKLPDGSFCLFGMNTHSWGQLIRTAVAHVDNGLLAAQVTEPTWQGSQNAVVRLSAAPIDADGSFVTAVLLVLKTDDSAAPNALTNKKTTDNLVLDYWRTK
jgi:hypothetical protein